jgi:cytochrome c oxidase subunit III
VKAVSEDFRIVEEPKKPLSMHPKKFGMWLFLASVIMLFASLTSAYIVRQAEGNWVFFELPQIFYSTTIVVLLSSVTMQWAYFAARKDELRTVRIMMTATAVLGLAFLAGQMKGWYVDMAGQGIHFVGNPSGSFVIVLVVLHGVHLVSAIVFVLVVLGASMKGKVRSANLAQIEMCATYWHFLGGLWLYLFVFLLLNR